MNKTQQEILAQGQDILQIFDAALRAGGGTFTCETHGKAVHWRHKAYRVRKAYRLSVMPKISPYDRLTLRKVAPDSCDVKIDIVTSPGIFTPDKVGPNTFAPTASPATTQASGRDELEDEATALARSLGIDGDVL